MSDQTSSPEELIFYGKEDEDVTSFLQKVKRVAFGQGRQRDQEWLVDYLETCLSGKALIWYLGLDEKSKSSFTTLSIAMIGHFPVPSASIPSALAAAAPPPAPGFSPSTSLSRPSPK
ncbi:hypothetical protein FRB96_001320 [Tulasnella sp. 330]|nr:hypothetical protein FRB96_001320 [Tulasnella sp. 330]KAG8888373.1 hypothetical protein FRB98_007768 [Tulasnella sp. 332]